MRKSELERILGKEGKKKGYGKYLNLLYRKHWKDTEK